VKPWVVLRAEALADIEHAQIHFSNFSEELEARFSLELERCVEQIRDFPESHPVMILNVRRALLIRFSIAVYYIAHRDSVEILAVMDARRDPKKWQDRV
jgi:plasmid stabilization system protein ParE